MIGAARAKRGENELLLFRDEVVRAVETGVDIAGIGAGITGVGATLGPLVPDGSCEPASAGEDSASGVGVCELGTAGFEIAGSETFVADCAWQTLTPLKNEEAKKLTASTNRK